MIYFCKYIIQSTSSNWKNFSSNLRCYYAIIDTTCFTDYHWKFRILFLISMPPVSDISWDKNYHIHAALRVHCKVFPFLSFTSNILKSYISTYLIKFGFKNISSKNVLWPAFRNARAHISSLISFIFAVCCWSISPISCWLKSNVFENLEFHNIFTFWRQPQ